MSHRPLPQRFLIAILGFLAAMVVIGSPLVSHPVRAQLSVVVAEDIPKRTDDVLGEIFQALSQAAVVAFFNAARTFAGQIAYDAANYIASGGTGQGALAFEDGFGKYLENVGSDTAGEFIGSLSEEFFQDAGFDLCRPPNPGQLLNLQISISNAIPGLDPAATQRPRPRCDFQQIVTNYTNLYTTLSNAEVSDFISTNFNANSSELGISSSILGRSTFNITDEVKKATAERQEGDGFKAVEGKVDGNIKTPASTVKTQTEEELVKKPSKSESDAFLATMGTAFEQGFSQLASYTASLFINTLANKLLSRVMERGILGAFDFSSPTNLVAVSPDAILVRSKTDARKANVDLKNVSLLRVSDVEINAELIACPENRGLWNCTADESLAQLIQGKTSEGNPTIRLAMDKEWLKPTWKLIPVSDVRQNQDRNCYREAYCAGNLQKLRAMRILPVGFEFAANSTENVSRCASAGGCVTLREVVEGFANCNVDGNRDAEHPWCKLIDPNWVVTSFQQQCQLTGYGDTLISTRLGQRREECRDIETCLRRNDKGECVGGYGYCVAEKNVYRFNADECPAEYASCRTFANRAGQNVSYLRSSIDYSVCSADNVGCLEYATNRNVAGDWQSTGGQINFDKTLEPCSASDEGCTRLMSVEVGSSALNVVQNPSFETVSSTAAELENWTRLAGGATYSTPVVGAGSQALDGTVATNPSNSLRQDVDTIPLRLYTVSAWVRANGASPSVNVTVRQYQSAPGAARVESSLAELSTAFKGSGCSLATQQPQITTTGRPIDNNWQRFECSFLSVSSTRYSTIEIDGSSALVDAVQLEEGQFATNFLTGNNRDLATLYMKVAPDDFQCTGALTDPAQCNNYAKVCRQVDAGCQGYTDKAGGPEVPAILTSNDVCPQECVGYAEFRKQPSSFDLVNDPDSRFSDPVDSTSSYFIPTTALQCTQEQVGCEAFTNVAASAEGGEQASHWSYLRACRKPDLRTTTYFTWEGSESTGYQLRTFALVGQSGVTPPGPEILPKRGPDGLFKEPSACNEGLWRTGVDPDCRQYYDRDGNVFYRYSSQTILSTDDCVDLRISRNTGRDDCAKTGGDFNAVTGECIYRAFLGESRSCPATAASCRAYAGAAAGNTQVVLSENFRAGRGTFSAGTASPESLLVGDQSLRLNESEPNTSASFASVSDGLYRVSFWAKGAGRNDLNLNFGVRDALTPGATPVDVGSVRLSTDWQRFTIGLFSGAANAGSSTLSIALSGSGIRAAFIDEVRIERIRDTAFVIRDSWNTPISCDRSFSGAIEPQAMLGCRAYMDRFNREVNAFRFSRLCRAEGIGCRAFVDTRNSDSPYSQTFNQADVTPVPVFNDPAVTFGSAQTVRPGDRMLYLVYDQSKVCQRENASCRAFGKPVYNANRSTIESYETLYIKDDITKYGEALCKPSENRCEEYSYNGAKDYFRDPQKQICEFKQGVRLSSADFPTAPGGSVLARLSEAEYDGWFVVGSSPSMPCYPDGLEGGRNFPLPKRGDVDWAGWTGLCPGTASECTEFRDINDSSDVLHRSGKPYYFINNDRLDKRSCEGNIDVGQGCVLMRDISDPVLKYSVAASYYKYEKNDFRPTAPIDCFRTPSDPACLAVGNATTSDANVLLKVNVDRDCAQWLGCQSSETVFDSATSKYKEICTNVALCDQATDKPGDIFCANYVDRAATSTEAVMQRGKFFDIGSYVDRPVGLGEKDYSGYAIPNSFQIPEMVTARVGTEGAKNVENNQYRFALDYRLAASVPIPLDRIGTTNSYRVRASVGPNEARQLTDANSPLARANPELSLCQHVSTGIIGYYLPAELSDAGLATRALVNCYLPVKSGGDNYNFQNVSTRFSLDDPRTDPALTNAFPPAECRVNPEADSPFGASYVTEWDLTTNPPKPTSKISGFQSSQTCEFGEDCVCNYKRADYGSTAFSRFFSPLSQNVPPGICQGGPRDGQACLPSTIFQVQKPQSRTSSGSGSGSSETTELVQGIEGSNAAQTCGDPAGGGRCVAFTKLEIIRGVFGQCLERDETRIQGSDLSNKPCLTWNPTPILFGDKDSFHYQPTSGYLPPQNSGQYYCVSPVKKPAKAGFIWNMFSQFDSVHNGSGFGDNEVKAANMYYAGDDDWDHTEDSVFDSNRRARLRFFAGWMTKIDYRDQWVSADNSGVLGEDQNYFASIFGANPSSYYTATTDCELADDDQDDDGSFDEISGGSNQNDFYGIRLVDAGAGYGEYFLRTNDDNVAQALQTPISPSEAHDSGSAYVSGDSLAVQVRRTEFFESVLSDNTISYFKIDPIKGPHGRIACGYQAAWVDNLGSVNYDDAGSNRPKDTEWRDKFYENYNPYLTRGQEGVYTDGGGRPFQVDCAASSGEKCYVKFWEADYRSANQKKFIGLQRASQDGGVTNEIARNFLDIRKNPIQSTCENSKPYFAVRAVFESRATNTTVAAADLNEDTVNGPWRFVGFWVSACGGDTGGDQRYIYMNMEVGTASVCKELAEVKSKNSGQDAAFTDRVWRRGDFREPGTGLQYSDNASPFSSAINTGPAGKDPLFQNGSELAGFSPLNPPIFLAPPSQTYYRPSPVPKDKYAYLSNLFARIYRVYRFQFLPVNVGDNACTVGPFRGTRCNNLLRCSTDLNTSCATLGSSAGCSAGGTCISTALACNYDGACRTPLGEGERASQRVCTSGISRMLSCAESEDVCKTPTFAKDDGSLVSLTNSCDINTADTWIVVDATARTYRRTTGDTTIYTVEQAASRNAFRCASGSVNTAAGSCKFPGAASFDCPINIDPTGTGNNLGGTCTPADGRCTYPASMDPIFRARGISEPEERNACTSSSDCTFTGPTTCDKAPVGSLGRCVGGVRDSEMCWMNSRPRAGSIGACSVGIDQEDKDAAAESCVPVSDGDGSPISSCLVPDQPDVPTTSTDQDNDNNICTHSGGYQPRIDICPNPSDEFCGLIAYRITDRAVNGSLDPNTRSPLPTDHTLGMYTPTFLGFTGAGVGVATFRYMAYYTPRPPRLAAPDIRNCPVPGQCPISRLDAFSFNGQSEGVINVGGGSQKSTMRFYAWAAHNQMPLRQVVIDWGDGKKQRLDDTRLKNRKPFCGVQRECSNAAGLTCQTDADCPAGIGRCVAVGTCAQNANLTCSQDTDCTVGGVTDTCNIRTMFGNSTDACQADYYDFAHLYSCGALESSPTADGGLQRCTASPRCSRDPNRTCTTPGSTSECAPGDVCTEGLAPIAGCFDDELRSCKFTPRILLQDNWGWCTGECRNGLTGGQPDDLTTNLVKHPNGGCWTGSTLGNDPNIRFNDRAANNNSVGNTVISSSLRECRETHPDAFRPNLRPWIVYPGSLQLRESGERAP